MIDLITSSFHFFRINVFNRNSKKWPILKKFCDFSKRVEEFDEIVPKDQYELFSSKNEKREIVFKSEWKNRENPLFFRHLKLLFWQFFSVKITFSFFEITKKRGGSKHFSTEGFSKKINVFARFSRISGVLIKFERILHGETIFRKVVIRVSVPDTFDNRWGHAQIMFQTGWNFAKTSIFVNILLLFEKIFNQF